MSDTIIKVENLSKRYRIGLHEKKADTFAQQMVNVLKYPIDNFRKIKKLGRFQGEEEEGVHWALKDVSFEVKQGEVLGIIGKNGAGKSTLLKILSKITEPTSGRIELHGRVAALLEVGTGFHPELTGRENIYMNGTILGMTKKEIDSKLDEIIDFSGVEKYVDTPVKFYSSGMRVRLGFSVAAHLEPEILIIDEVLAVGDNEFQQKCLGKMEDVSQKEGRTVLFVSHNMASVENLCSKAILLNEGKLIFSSNTSSVMDYYIKLGKNIFQNNTTVNGIELDIKVNQNESAVSGKNFQIEIKLNSSHEYKNCVIALGINTVSGGRVFTFQNLVQTGRLFNLESGKVKLIKIDQEKLLLSPGIYRLICTLYQNSEKISEYGEFSSFEVLAGDYYNTGKLVESSYQGNILPEVNWRF